MANLSRREFLRRTAGWPPGICEIKRPFNGKVAIQVAGSSSATLF